jgi:hypothetical protein
MINLPMNGEPTNSRFGNEKVADIYEGQCTIDQYNCSSQFFYARLVLVVNFIPAVLKSC